MVVVSISYSLTNHVGLRYYFDVPRGAEVRLEDALVED